ncbi:hypothetical protein IMG5_100760 [Ichthyophthirius multifiliis]|uniref:Transmembrane protein n=1 Tax=Ichthyophthirius multifiliis TaxID=5932 RepID=G0QSF3_ICHMU|nr:hypothetical protein IMG5_100760 [Ichthyophthirius multifiliis]EGR31854.1 hypothetical protein IMG5_100760 [Ichthyophthirius multifiliis]|eukprot:XP_004035340.1 hypothetical protein IMG5_100760 [Ichthyophthirius multifiliis]
MKLLKYYKFMTKKSGFNTFQCFSQFAMKIILLRQIQKSIKILLKGYFIYLLHLNCYTQKQKKMKKQFNRSFKKQFNNIKIVQIWVLLMHSLKKLIIILLMICSLKLSQFFKI